MESGRGVAELIDITTSEFKRNPFPWFAKMREEQPVVRVLFGKQPAWLVTRYADVDSVLRDARFIKNRSAVTSRRLPVRLR